MLECEARGYLFPNQNEKFARKRTKAEPEPK